ncbi:MAG: hypothetical protein IK095_05150 [Oscillospiraceae bacterium]|nr:hypothetical protein [Oscillospiraceae bacterium]
MSKPREPWWGYVKNVIRDYPAAKRDLEELRRGRITPNYNATGGGSGPSRTTEAVATRELPPRRQQRMEAVERAIGRTMRRSSGALRLRIVELVFFKGSHTLRGAGMACHVSYATAKIWQQDFIYAVADELGLR